MRRLVATLLLLLWGTSLAWSQDGQLINGSRTITGTFNAGTATGSSNSYLLTLIPPITAYVPNQCFTFRANHTNTSAATLSVNGLAAVPLKKYVGGLQTDVVADDIGTGQHVEACYDGTVMNAHSLDGGGGGGAGGAPTGGSYLTRQAEPGLSAESNLGSLSTGLLMCTVVGGACTPSIATPGTHYQDPATSVTAASPYTSGDLVQAAGNNRTTASSGLQAANVAQKAPASPQTLTNTVIDCEAAGNVCTTSSKSWLSVAGCDGTTGYLLWDAPTGAPTPTCLIGTNTMKGVAEFPDDALSALQTRFPLPGDWAGAIDVRLPWLTTGTSGDVVWHLATVCVSDGQTDDPPFNAASTVIDTAKVVNSQLNFASGTTLNTTGCTPGALMHLRLWRDGTAGTPTDTLAATARLYGLELTLRRAQ